MSSGKGRPIGPAKLTSKVLKRICAALRRGNTRENSAELSGISPGTFFGWVRKAKEGDELYIDFFEAVKKAEAQAEDDRVARIAKAAKGSKNKPGSWQADAWWLERRRYRRWHKRESMEVTGKDGQPVQIETEVSGEVSLFDDINTFAKQIGVAIIEGSNSSLLADRGTQSMDPNQQNIKEQGQHKTNGTARIE